MIRFDIAGVRIGQIICLAALCAACSGITSLDEGELGFSANELPAGPSFEPWVTAAPAPGAVRLEGAYLGGLCGSTRQVTAGVGDTTVTLRIVLRSKGGDPTCPAYVVATHYVATVPNLIAGRYFVRVIYDFFGQRPDTVLAAAVQVE